MSGKPLHVVIKEKILDEQPAEEQRALLKTLARTYGPNASKGEPMSCPDAAFADRRYSVGELLPQTYCYLAFCSKMLAITTSRGAAGVRATARLWGYVISSMMDDDMRAGAIRTMAADAKEEPPHDDRIPPVNPRPLKETMTAMVRSMLHDNDRDGLRELVRWAYGAYEPYWKTLLDQSHHVDRWMTNVSELLPRLLLRNCIPLHDSLAVRDPKIVVAMYTSPGLPPAFNDPGVLVARSTFVRTLFAEEEIRALEQAGQRIAELFAHAYPLLLIRDPEREMAEVRARILRMVEERGRLRALQHLETLYRHSLRIPTCIYREMKHAI